MSALATIAPFLALVDRTISLIKARKTRRKKYFKEIIDPLYMQFKPLGEDYLKLFRDSRSALLSSKKKSSRKEATNVIRKRRDEFSSARLQLRALLEVCEKNPTKKRDEEMTQFVRAMTNFFAPTGMVGIVGSRGKELVNFFEELEHRGTLASAGEIFIQSGTAQLEKSWYEIAGRYMELKLKYLDE